MRPDSLEVAGMEKGVALEDGYLIMISGPTKLRSVGNPDEKCLAASNVNPLLDLVQRG